MTPAGASRPRGGRFLLLAFWLAGGCAGTEWTPSPSTFEEVAGLTQAELVAFNPEDDLTARATQDGRFIVFVSERNGNLDIWVRDYGRESTYPLTRNPADDFDPALVPGRASIVFVSRRSDAKGDLFLADGLGPGASVERLTDATTQDRQPVVSPDGRRVYFTAAAGLGLEFIAELDLDSKETRRISPTPGFDPAVSPDGRYLIYTAPADPDRRFPHLVALRFSDSATVALGSSDASATPEGFATFFPTSEKGPYALAFVRFPDDDNGDGVVDARDLASLWRLDVDLDSAFVGGAVPNPYPLTDGGNDELFPDAGDGQLYFTQGALQQDILRLPAHGMFPVYDDPAQYLQLAEVLDDPRTRWFALRTAVARAGDDSATGAAALYRIGKLQLVRGEPRLARRDFQRQIEASKSAPANSPQWRLRGLAEVEAAALDRGWALRDAVDPEARDWAIRQGRRRIEALAQRYPVPDVQSRVALEQAELLIAEGERTRAVQALEAIGAQTQGASAVAAQAMLRRIELLGIVHDPEALSEAYAQVTQRFPTERAVVAEAATRLVDVRLQGLTRRYGTKPETDALRRLIERFAVGPIRRAARWRLVERLKRADALDAAALELAELVKEATDDRLARAKALRAMAEVDEARGAGDSALTSWRSLLRAYPDLPGFAAAARAAISRVNLAAAAASEAEGNLEDARQAYRRVIENDVGAVEAHRRYTALSARLGKLAEARRAADRRAQRSRGTPVARYAYALALTWEEPPLLDDALEEVEAAIALNPQLTEAYLLRGWIREMQELEEPGWFSEGLQVIYERVIESIIAVFASDQDEVGQRGLLELAIDDYKTALRLNNEAVKPRLEAEILLNLGNGHYRLADATNDPPNMRQAFNRYTEVVALNYAFDQPRAEMVFWERFGRAASWSGEFGLSAMATRRALVLARRLKAEPRRLQQLGNLALAYDQAGEDDYAKVTRRRLSDADNAEAVAGRAAIRLREKARVRLGSEGDQDRAGYEAVLDDLAAARSMLDQLDGDPRALPTLWLALSKDPTSAQYGFGPRGERNVNLALAESTHRALGDIGRADQLAEIRAQVTLEQVDNIPGAALGFVNQWPTSVLQVRERFGLLMAPAQTARRAGRWNEVWSGLTAADAWLERTVESRLVSGSRTLLWLERARWATITASWQSWARSQGLPPAPDEPPIETTLQAGDDAVGLALALVTSATATAPLPAVARNSAWSTPRTEALPEVLSTTTAIAMTASVARSRPTLAPLRRATRAMAARLEYARGLRALSESRVSMRARASNPGGGPSGVSTDRLGALLTRADQAVERHGAARAHFVRAARLAAGSGPGLGHRVLVLSLVGWADTAFDVDPAVVRFAEDTAIDLAETIGEVRLAWSVRLASAAAGRRPIPSFEGIWPGFVADDLDLVDQLLAATASRALARGELNEGFVALERRLCLRSAAGPVVELDNRRAPDDQTYTVRLRSALKALDEAKVALSSATLPTESEWSRVWAQVAAARSRMATLVEDGELVLSSAAQTRVLGLAQSSDTLRYDLGPKEGLLFPANVQGQLELLFVDGSTTAKSAVEHRKTGVMFAALKADIEAVWRDIGAGRRPDPARTARLRRHLFSPMSARLRDKRTVIIVAGDIGGPLPRAIWPQGPAWSQVHAATPISELRSAMQVGGRQTLRIPAPPPYAPLIDGTSLSLAEAVQFRAPSSAMPTVDGTVRLSGRPPVEVLPDQVLELFVAEAPLRIEPAAPERSAFRLAPSARQEDAYEVELPLGGLTVPARTLVLARTGLAQASERSAVLRLDATLAVSGYPSTVVVPQGVPVEATRGVIEAVAAAPDKSPAAAVARAQDRWRDRFAQVDQIFVVGMPGMDREAAIAYAKSRVRGVRSRAVSALGKRDYRLAVPFLERWIRLQRAASDNRRIEGIYGALVGLLRDKIEPPRPARAADVQAELLELMEAQGIDTRRRAEARIELAHLLSRAHDFEAAEREFAAALEVLEADKSKRVRLARAWFYYAQHKVEQKAYEEAAIQVERAIALYEALGVYSSRTASGEAQRALLLAGQIYLNNISDPVRAKRAFERVKRYADSEPLRISAELDLARAARRRGAFLDAAAHTERARNAAVKAGYADLELVAQIEAANIAWYQGDYRLGQELCQRNLELADRRASDVRATVAKRERLTKDKKALAQTRANAKRTLRTIRRRRTYALSVCGLLAMSQRDFDGAVDYLEEARGVAERLGDDSEVSAQLNNLGRVYLEFGRLETAVETFRRALAIDERLDDRYAQAYDLRNLGRALALQGVHEEARQALSQGLAFAEDVRDLNNELRARFAIAQLDLDEGRPKAAAAGFQRALPLAQRLQVKELEWQIHRELGRLAWRRGDRAAADAALGRAIRIARTITGRTAPSDYAPDRFEAFEDLIRLKLDSGDATAAFLVAEEARRIQLIELLADGRLDLGAVGPVLQTLRLTETSTEAAAARETLRRLAPRVAELWAPSTPAALAARLPEDAAVVQYEITGPSLVVFVLTLGRAVREDRRCECGLGVAAGRWHDFGRQIGRSRRRHRRIGGGGEPVADRAHSRLDLDGQAAARVRFAGHPALRGAARACPWVMPAMNASSTGSKSMQALDARAGVADALVRPRRAGSTAPVTAVGAAPPPPGAPDRPLPFAPREIEAIAEEFPSTRRVLGERVTRARLLRGLARPQQVFHFAGHSYLAGSPEAGRLTDPLGGQLRTADGGVTTLDLLRNPVGAQTVVLSTCSSLVGSPRTEAVTGEDVLSMAESLHIVRGRGRRGQHDHRGRRGHRRADEAVLSGGQDPAAADGPPFGAAHRARSVRAPRVVGGLRAVGRPGGGSGRRWVVVFERVSIGVSVSLAAQYVEHVVGLYGAEHDAQADEEWPADRDVDRHQTGGVVREPPHDGGDDPKRNADNGADKSVELLDR